MCGNEGRGAQESEARVRDVRGEMKAARRRVRKRASVGVESEVMVQVLLVEGQCCSSEARSDWLESRPWSVGSCRRQPSLRSALDVEGTNLGIQARPLRPFKDWLGEGSRGLRREALYPTGGVS